MQSSDKTPIYYFQNIHGCAINCVMISLLIQQLILLFFNTVRANGTSGLLPPRYGIDDS